MFDQAQRRRLRERVKSWYVRLVRTKADPTHLGVGAALGVWVGFVPTLFPQSVWAVGAAWLLKGNYAAAISGTFVSNPFTAPFLLPAYYWVGSKLVPGGHPPFNLERWITDPFNVGVNLAVVLTVGGAVLGLPAALATYALVKNAAAKYQEKRARRTARRKALFQSKFGSNT